MPIEVIPITMQAAEKMTMGTVFMFGYFTWLLVLFIGTITGFQTMLAAFVSLLFVFELSI